MPKFPIPYCASSAVDNLITTDAKRIIHYPEMELQGGVRETESYLPFLRLKFGCSRVGLCTMLLCWVKVEIGVSGPVGGGGRYRRAARINTEGQARASPAACLRSQHNRFRISDTLCLRGETF